MSARSIIIGGVPVLPTMAMFRDWRRADAIERLQPADAAIVDHAIARLTRIPTRSMSDGAADAWIDSMHEACRGLSAYWLLVTVHRFIEWSIDRETLRHEDRSATVAGDDRSARRWRPEPGEVACATRLAAAFDHERIGRAEREQLAARAAAVEALPERAPEEQERRALAAEKARETVRADVAAKTLPESDREREARWRREAAGMSVAASPALERIMREKGWGHEPPPDPRRGEGRLYRGPRR